MRYDPALPRAVFLGPSLDPATARALLPANYYPPARMGDIYRLLASGVETIAIIDGVFHHSTPVWQREILAALEAGIRVVGGASMGALRAAELAAYGMEGVGTIFDWYRDGVLDGDDEVALVHADAALDYRALSEPLVNMRHNLARARARGLLDGAAHDALVAWVKTCCFSARSWRALTASPPWQALPAAGRRSLEAFVAHDLEDLKQADARAVLARIAAPAATPTAAPPPRWSYPGSARTRLQAALTPRGELVDGATVLTAALAASSEWVEPCLRAARARCYLDDWLALGGANPAPAMLAAHRARLLPAAARDDPPAWCRAHGLTTVELAEALEARARTAWIEAGDPAMPGPEWASQAALLAACADPPDACEARRAAALADWAYRRGIDAPAAELAAARRDWCRAHGLDAETARTAALASAVDAHALAAWLLGQDPGHFGFERFAVDAELLLALKLDGRHAALVAALAATPADTVQASAG